MRNKIIDNFKLGIFVILGVIFLIILLFTVGKNKNLFGSSYTLKAEFQNVHGLVKGNNVRYSGIHVGTVKDINIIDMNSIIVTMNINKEMKHVIHKDAVATVGTDGLVGNKVVDISPNAVAGIIANDNEFINSKEAINTEEIFSGLSNSNTSIESITRNLVTITDRIVQNNNLWAIIEDKNISNQILKSIENTKQITENVNILVRDLSNFTQKLNEKESNLGFLISDTTLHFKLNQISDNLNETSIHLRNAGSASVEITKDVQDLAKNIKSEWDSSNGSIKYLLNDTLSSSHINRALESIASGAESFNQNMEALKHNFFFRGYFKKLEKEKEKDRKKEKIILKDKITY